MKKILFILLIFASQAFSQTGRFEVVVQDSTGATQTGKTVTLKQSGVLQYTLTEDATTSGTYYVNAVIGTYDVYVDGELVRTGKFHGTDKLTTMSAQFNSSGLLDGSTVQDSTITGNELTSALHNLIGSGGSITNNPDDVTLENKGGSTIGIKTTYTDTILAAYWGGGFNIYNTSQFASLAVAIDSVNANDNSVLLINSSTTITANDTIDNGVSIIIQRGGSINTTSGDTLWINGELKGPRKPILLGDGEYRFTQRNGTYQIFPEWFGAVGDQSNDDTAALQKTIRSLGGTGQNGRYFEIILTGTYKVTDSLTMDVDALGISHLMIKGKDMINARDQDVNIYSGTLIDASSLPVNKSLFEIRGNGNSGAQTVVIKNLRIDGHTAAGSGNIINAYSLRSLELKNLNIEGAANNAINIDGSKGVVQHLVIDDCRIAQRSGEAYRAGSYGIADSAGINQFNMNRVNLSLWDHNVWHKGGSPNSTLPWKWNYVFAVSAGKESVYIEDRGDNTYINCAFESSGQTDSLAAELKLVNALGGYFVNTFIGSDTNNDTAAVVLDSCVNISFVNTLSWDNTTGDALLRIIGGERIRIHSSQMSSGSGGGIILDLDSSGDPPLNIQIVDNYIGVLGFPILLNSFGSETLSNSVIKGNILESSGGNIPISGIADIDSSSLVINAPGLTSNLPYSVPYFHKGLTVAGNLAIGASPNFIDDIELKIFDIMPQQTWYESDASVDNKRWEFRITDEVFYFKAVNDAFSGDNNIFSVTRSNYTPTDFKLGTYLTLPEKTTPATPASGFGTIFVTTAGVLNFKNDAGIVFDLTEAGSGSGITDIQNVGAGSNVLKEIISNVAYLRNIRGDSLINVAVDGNDIVISLSGSNPDTVVTFTVNAALDTASTSKNLDINAAMAISGTLSLENTGGLRTAGDDTLRLYDNAGGIRMAVVLDTAGHAIDKKLGQIAVHADGYPILGLTTDISTIDTLGSGIRIRDAGALKTSSAVAIDFASSEFSLANSVGDSAVVEIGASSIGASKLEDNVRWFEIGFEWPDTVAVGQEFQLANREYSWTIKAARGIVKDGTSVGCMLVHRAFSASYTSAGETEIFSDTLTMDTDADSTQTFDVTDIPADKTTVVKITDKTGNPSAFKFTIWAWKKEQ